MILQSADMIMAFETRSCVEDSSQGALTTWNSKCAGAITVVLRIEARSTDRKIAFVLIAELEWYRLRTEGALETGAATEQQRTEQIRWNMQSNV